MNVRSASIRHLADQNEFRSICGFRRDLVAPDEGELAAFHYMRISDSRRHYHVKTTEYYFVTEGRGEMELDDATVALAQGDLVVVPPGVRHTTRPAKDADLHVLIVAIPCPEPGADPDHFYD